MTNEELKLNKLISRNFCFKVVTCKSEFFEIFMVLHSIVELYGINFVSLKNERKRS